MEQLRIVLYRNCKLVTVLVAVIGTIFMAGCIAPETKQPGDESKMSIEEAIAIAQNSTCLNEGSLTDKYVYNPDSGTWWIDLDPFTPRESCNPACVVSEDTKTAEINWRCTGLKEGFCGWSTNGTCLTDLDCIKGGCSGQVCQSKHEEPVMTTCEWRDCYDAEMYGVACQCVNGHCQWYK